MSQQRSPTVRVPEKKSKTEDFIPLAAPWFGPEEKQEILAVLDSDWITTGPRTRKFEEEFAAYVGVQHAVALNSCTAALHLGLAALDLGPGDAAITVPFTFSATGNVICHCGAQPILIDIEPDTYNIDPKKLLRFLSTQCEWNAAKQLTVEVSTGRRVRALTAVHYGGHPCDMDEIMSIARRFGLVVLEDAAHAVGAKYKGRHVGNLGDMAAFSFYATKNLCTGEGGMFTSNNSELAERVRRLSLHGMSRDAWRRYGREGSWQYDVLEAGFKCNLSDLASALGLHQLRKLDGFNRRRAGLARRYSELLSDLPLQLPVERDYAQSAWHLYPVQVMTDRITRDEVIEQLRARNIGASVHFIPLHLLSHYRERLGFRRGDFEVAESVFGRILSLPLFPRMQDEDVDRVANALHEIVGAG
jgi:dTDP-4-amino-4,6-dideoxygalactose transaminase